MSKKGFKIQTKNKKKIKKKKSKNKEKIEENLEKKEKIGTSGASGGESFSFFVRTTPDIEENLETFVEASNVSLPSSFQEENRIEKREKKEKEKYEFTSFYEEKKEKEPEIEKISREAPRESNFLIKEDLLQNFKQQKEPIKIIKDTFVSSDKFDEEKDVQVVKKYLREQRELEEGSKYREKDKYKYKQYIEVI